MLFQLDKPNKKMSVLSTYNLRPKPTPASFFNKYFSKNYNQFGSANHEIIADKHTYIQVQTENRLLFLESVQANPI